MMEGLKYYFEIIQSMKAVEYYSDNSGSGKEGISSSGIANETLAFAVPKKNKNGDLFCKILELGYIGEKIGLKDWLIFPYIKYFIKNEGETIRTIDRKTKGFLKKSSINYLLCNIQDKLIELKNQNKKVFFQNRLEWQRQEDEKFYYYHRRLAIHICDKDVYILNDDLLTDNQKANQRYSEMVN